MKLPCCVKTEKAAQARIHQLESAIEEFINYPEPMWSTAAYFQAIWKDKFKKLLEKK